MSHELAEIIEYFIRLGSTISYPKILLYSFIVIVDIELVAFIVRKVKNERFIFTGANVLYRVNLYAFVLFSNFVLRLTYFGREWGSRPQDTKRIYLSLAEIFSRHGLLNTILFMPFGFLIYGVFRGYKRLDKWVLSFLCSMVFTIGIEMAQFLTESGRFEVSDLICNTMGGGIGAAIALAVYEIFSKRKQNT